MKIDYTTLTPEQAAKTARAETLKEIIEFCNEQMEQWNGLPEETTASLAIAFIHAKCRQKLNAIQ